MTHYATCGCPEVGRLWMGYWDVGIVYSLTEATFRTFSPVRIPFLLATVVSSAEFIGCASPNTNPLLTRSRKHAASLVTG